MTTLQKVYTTLGIIISAAVIIGAVDAYSKSKFACKGTEIKVEEASQNIASMAQSIQKGDLRSEIRFLHFELRQLEGEYVEKPKDKNYIIRKMDLEQKIKDAQDTVNSLKGK